jgi:hypothetical protein
MNIIPKSKFGDCIECGLKNTDCVKVGKNLYCISCRTIAKKKNQLKKAQLNTKVRSLIKPQAEVAERQYLIQDLDNVFSKYIRISHSDKNGFCTCFTCNKIFHWTKVDCGHYIKRSDTLLRWDKNNAKPQCKECNQFLHGNIDVYTERLNEENPGVADMLREQSRDINKFSRQDLKELFVDLSNKLRLVELKFK